MRALRELKVRDVVDVGQAELLVGGLDAPEGVAWDPNGYVYAGSKDGQLFRFALGTGELASVARPGGRLLGLAIDSSGDVYACDETNRCVWRIEPATGTHECFSRGAPEEEMRTPNYPVFAADGTLFVSDSGDWESGGGKIFAITDGRTVAVDGTESANYPNGLAIDPTGRWLYVVESRLPGVVRFKLGDGRMHDREIVWMSEPGSVPDGLAFTASGALIVAFYQPNQVILVEDDRTTVLASSPGDSVLAGPTNVAYFGAGLQRLVTANIRGSHLTEVTTDQSLHLAGAPLSYPSR